MRDLEVGQERITMKPQRNTHKARSVIRQAVERVADRHSLLLEAAREWLYREAMAKRASLDHVTSAIIAEQPIHYQHPVPSQLDRTTY